MTAQSPSVIDALTAVQDDLALRMRTVVPAVVVSYDPATQSAAIQPAPKERTPGGEFRALAQIPNAPVVFPSGGGWSISWSLVADNEVLLLCSDRGLDRWRSTGSPYAPEDGRKHHLSAAFVWPGAGPAPDPITGLSATDLVIRGPGGVAIQVTPAGAITIAAAGQLASAARVGDAVAPTADMQTWITAVAGVTGAAAPVGFGRIAAGSALVQIG